jgi:hypothetical protein
MHSWKPVAVTAVVAAVLAAALMPVGAGAQVKHRPFPDFIAQQRTTVTWWPPVPDYIGWNAASSEKFALVDYCGTANEWLKANGGPNLHTKVKGTVMERRLPDGRAEVTVCISTQRALAFGSSWAGTDDWQTLWFGYQAPEVAAGATPALGDCEFTAVFCNTKPGAPLPNLAAATNIPGSAPPGFEMRYMSFFCVSKGPLRAESGLGPEGAPGMCVISQVGLYTPDNQGGTWPIEVVEIKALP